MKLPRKIKWCCISEFITWTILFTILIWAMTLEPIN